MCPRKIIFWKKIVTGRLNHSLMLMILRGGSCWNRTSDQAVMHLTIAFATPFEFVSWTIPSSQKDVCHLVSTPSHIETWAWLGIVMAQSQKISPNLTDNRLKITSQTALQNSSVLYLLKKIIAQYNLEWTIWAACSNRWAKDPFFYLFLFCAWGENWTHDTRIFNPLLYHWATQAQ